MIFVCLDLEKSELGFSVNEIDQGIAEMGIEKGDDVNYRLMISIWKKGYSVEIVNFKGLWIE